MVDDHDFFNVTQDLNACNRSNHVRRARSASPIAYDECLIMTQLKEMVRATSGVTTSDDAHPRAGADWRILIFEHFLNIVLVGSLEVKSDVGIKLVVSESFRHWEMLDDLLKVFVHWQERGEKAREKNS
jgi:hypothetical protein